MIDTPTRGERNNNPGNINFLSSSPWRGQVGLELVPAGMSYKPRFGRYDDIENGIRAIAMQLLAYRKAGFKTIRDAINRWAPPSDGNATSNYVQNVSRAVGVLPTIPLDIADHDILPRIVKAIISQENGRCTYDDRLIETACRDALSTLGPSKHG